MCPACFCALIGGPLVAAGAGGGGLGGVGVGVGAGAGGVGAFCAAWRSFHKSICRWTLCWNARHSAPHTSTTGPLGPRAPWAPMPQLLPHARSLSSVSSRVSLGRRTPRRLGRRTMLGRTPGARGGRLACWFEGAGSAVVTPGDKTSSVAGPGRPCARPRLPRAASSPSAAFRPVVGPVGSVAPLLPPLPPPSFGSESGAETVQS